MLYLEATKGRRERYIPISKKLKAYLDEYLEIRGDVVYDDYLFVYPGGGRKRLAGDCRQFNHYLVNKVGRTTGWTTGRVTDTCAWITHTGDPNVGNFDYICQGIADYYSQGGDSGSPVFNRNRTEVNLVGIHWGSFTSGEERIFSPMANIREDIGSITTN